MKSAVNWISLILIVSVISCGNETYPFHYPCGVPFTSCEETYPNFNKPKLPENILNVAKEELLKLMTNEMYQKFIKLEDYNYIDSCEQTRNYKWTVPRHLLKFNWKQPKESIIPNYCFNVAIDNEGKLIDTIRMGNSLQNIDNNHFISKKEFKRIWNHAKANGMDFYQLNFDSERQILTIELGKTIFYGNSDVISSRTSKIISAHNGKVIE